MIVGGYLL